MRLPFLWSHSRTGRATLARRTSSPCLTRRALARPRKVRSDRSTISPSADTSPASRSTVAQLAQTSYLSLQTPYSHFGLGRTNNYVENLFIGSTRRQAQHFMNIEGVIPNSQVVIAPFQPRGVEADPSWWTKELCVVAPLLLSSLPSKLTQEHR